MEKLKVAFAGFRHYHIMEVWDHVARRDDLVVTAAAEDDEATRAAIAAKGVRFTHPSVDALLADGAAYDAVFVGDYFGRRGGIVLAALTAGKHVLADKPICTDLAEYRKIERLATRRRLAVGCQLSLRDGAPARTLRRLLAAGELGEVSTITILAQHPLRYGERPAWYFEPGKHGGTINDIAVHAVDFAGWATGRPVARILAARVWNNAFPQVPDFEHCGQLMLELEGGCGVMADVSYTAPSEMGYTAPQYWRISIHGERGVAETSLTADAVRMWRTGKTEPEVIPFDAPRAGGYLADFVEQVRGGGAAVELDTAQVLEATRVTLLAQRAAGRSRGSVRV